VGLIYGRTRRVEGRQQSGGVGGGRAGEQGSGRRRLELAGGDLRNPRPCSVRIRTPPLYRLHFVRLPAKRALLTHQVPGSTYPVRKAARAVACSVGWQ